MTDKAIESLKDPKKPRFKKRRLFLWLLLFLLALPFLLGLIVHIPAVQNYLVDYTADKLSEKIDGQVSVGEVDLSIFDGLSLNEFKVIDSRLDTIINGGSFSVSLRKNLFSIFNNSIDLTEVAIKGADISVKRYADSPRSNLAQLLEGFSQDNSEPGEGEATAIFLSKISLEDVSYKHEDMLQGIDYELSLEQGYIKFADGNLDFGNLEIEDIYLSNPIIGLRVDKKADVEFIAGADIRDKVEQQIEAELLDTSQLTINRLEIINGLISYNDLRVAPRAEKGLDYKHINFKDFNIEASSLKYVSTLDVSLELKKLSFLDEKNNFNLKNFSSEDISLNNRAITIKDYKMTTNKSSIQSSLKFKYRSFDSFKNFTDKVILDSDIDNAVLAYQDLLYFIPEIRNASFLKKNKNKTIVLKGSYAGRVNSLIGRDVYIKLADATTFTGDFSSRNLTKGGSSLLNLTVKNIETNFNDLTSIIPGFNPPQNFYKLGKMKFNGRFDGFLNDFVAYGTLESDLGTADMDMRLDLKKGRDNAQYSGNLALNDFDLKTWSDNEDLGILSGTATVKDGKGLTLDNAFANLDALIEKIDYKGYRYTNLLMDGELDKKHFVGEFLASDSNLDFKFKGDVIYDSELPILDFEASINKIDLFALNLSKEPLSIQTDLRINAQGANIGEVKGDADITRFTLMKNDTTYVIDSVHIYSYLLENNNRKVAVNSELLDFSLKGKLNLKTIENDIKRLLKVSFPKNLKSLKIENQTQNIQEFVYTLKIKDTKNFTDFLNIDGLDLNGTEASGQVNNSIDFLIFNANIPEGRYKNYILNNTVVIAESSAGEGSLSVSMDSSQIAGLAINPSELNALFAEDKFLVNIATDKLIDSLETLNIAAQIEPVEKGYSFSISEKEWMMFGVPWSFVANNYVVIGSDYLDISGLQLTDGYRFITLKDIDNKGLTLGLNNFNFLMLSKIIDYDKMEFTGEGDVGLVIDDMFSQGRLDADISVPDFRVNNDKFGALKVIASKKSGSELGFSVSLGDDRFDIELAGSVNTETQAIDGSLVTRDAPVDIMEYIIDSGISLTSGKADIDIVVGGKLDDPKMDGKVFLKNGGTRIDYTGTYYSFDEQTIGVTESYFDFNGLEIRDSEGNPGYISGGMRHSFLQDFRQEVDMYSPDIIALNTTKNENPLYYGFGKGEVSLSFRGPFEATNMVVEAVTGPRSKLSIPAQVSVVGYEESFIEFVDANKYYEGYYNNTPDIPDKYKIEGIDIEMNITMTEDAVVDIIFNEKLKDIITGRGNGDIQLYIKRSGEFEAFGEYVITQGEYLFTAYSLVAKPFKVTPGGVIRWVGDPINAELDIEAKYENVRTSLQIFLAEYLEAANPSVVTEANRNTDVDLRLLLGGTLFKPEISFDLDFPSLVTGELKSYVDSKLRLLRANPISLNNQVAGLILLKSFLPDNNPLAANFLSGNNLTQVSNSTLSEFMSQQLSDLLSGFVNAALPENSIISAVDVSIGLNNNVDITSSADAQLFDFLNPDEVNVELNPRFKFFGERFSLRVGGNYIRNSTFFPENSFIPDVAVEYDITDDRKLRLRFQYKYDFDQFDLNGVRRRQVYGVGLNYRKEFGKMINIQRAVTTAVEEAIKEEVEEQIELE